MCYRQISFWTGSALSCSSILYDQQTEHELTYVTVYISELKTDFNESNKNIQLNLVISPLGLNDGKSRRWRLNEGSVNECQWRRWNNSPV